MEEFWRMESEHTPLEPIPSHAPGLIRTVEVKSFNRRERRYTYDVIGIMKGEIEPGTFSEFFICLSMELICRRTLHCLRQSPVSDGQLYFFVSSTSTD